ncbi:MAG: AAA family ATPase [Bacteroidales bacterium]|nr:AAA family ATPase [Bacteroidales bacterium]
MSKNISLKIKARNIGPHIDLKSEHQMGSLNIGLFSNNGIGKTFLSRMFRIDEKEIEKNTTDKLITLQKNDAEFNFEIDNPDDKTKTKRTLKVVLKRNSEPNIVNDTGYIFHVFNSDFVSQNLEAFKYSPDGNIEGYILGKTNINISKEKDELENKVKEVDLFKETIRKSISDAKKDLDTLRINKNTTEYRNISFDNIYNGIKFSESLTFEQLKIQHNDFKSMPDDLADILDISFNYSLAFIEELKTVFTTPFLRSSLADDFKEKVNKKYDFIESGIKILNRDPQTDHTCPFCEQKFDLQASELIDLYNQYLDDAESRTKKRINNLISELKKLQESIKNSSNNYNKRKISFDNTKNYIPSFKHTELESLIDIKRVEAHTIKLIELLEEKKISIEKVDFNFQNIVQEIEDSIAKNVEANNRNNILIQKLNSVKNDSRNEKLKLNRKLCNVKYTKLSDLLSETVTKLKSIKKEVRELTSIIEEKENKEKVSKKSKVAESLSFFLNVFFNGKYSFDKKEFIVKFLNINIKDNASDILSDGEKSIVAFCYYLAETHTKVSNEDDYKNLFFVIDDPISSLDFHFVYAVSQIIRNIGTYFPLDRIRFLILTHNIEFMSILMRNEIIKQKFILLNNSIETLRDELVMPYESHLRDIYLVSKGIHKPTHTIPNSIRHVLETISRFENPNIAFKEYFHKISDFEGNQFLYSLAQDGSHGILRIEKAYTDDMIKNGCVSVIEFIMKKYSGQIDQISKKS